MAHIYFRILNLVNIIVVLVFNDLGILHIVVATKWLNQITQAVVFKLQPHRLSGCGTCEMLTSRFLYIKYCSCNTLLEEAYRTDVVKLQD